MTTLGEALDRCETRLAEKNFEDPHQEARMLLGGILGMSSPEIYVNRGMPISKEARIQLEDGVARRLKYEPVAFILGLQNFHGRDFSVDPRVLIPRPETEILVEVALSILAENSAQNRRVLEIGAGSGCVAVSLALGCPSAAIVSTDISAAALTVARANALAHNARNVTFLRGDLYAALPTETHRVFDMIAANPPYIATPDLASLDPDIAYEPRLALDGGKRGLEVIDRLVSGAPRHLRRGGVLIMEIGYNQALAASELLSRHGFKSIQFVKDYAGHDRVIKGEFSGPV